MKKIEETLSFSPKIKSTPSEHMSSSKTIPLSILIITYNSNNYIERCLSHIKDSTIHPKEIIIIDNNSDISPKNEMKNFIKSNNTKINFNLIYYESDENLGFAKGVNKCIELAKDNHYLLLNPDLFINSKSLEELWKFPDKNGIIGGKTLNIDNENMYPTVVKNLSFLSILIELTSLKKILAKLRIPNNYFWDLESNLSKKAKKVNAVSGCLFFLSEKAQRRIGEFDENFFLYLKDLDYCIRANKNDVSVYFLPKFLGKHVGGASSIGNENKINKKYWRQSKEYFCIKHFNLLGSLLRIIFKLDYLFVKFKKV